MTPTRRTRKQQKKTEQPIESSEEESSEAGSVTRCVCGQSHSLGLMVQCDKCEVWQHCECMGLNQDKLPEQYFCDQCQPDHHQWIKISNGRSKRLYNATKQGTNSDDDTSSKRRKTTQRNKPSPPQLNDMVLTEMVSTMTTITTMTTTTTIVTMTEEESETTPPEEPPILTRSRRIVKESEDEMKIKAPSPVQNEKKDEVIPSWDYKDGKPTGAITPPAKIKYPHAKMTFSEMNRRANQILECVSKMHVKLPEEQEDLLMKRARSLSTSSSSSSLSSASTVPLLDDYTTTSVSSPSTPLPFIPKHQETSIDILERVNRELIKFQRKFGSAYSSFGNKVK